jgi:hypothetical protein
MIKFFVEDIDQEIIKLKNVKSNLVLNLNLLDNKKNYQYIWDICNYELKIADLEILRGEKLKAKFNLMNSINYLLKYRIIGDLLRKICLRVLTDEDFSDDFRLHCSNILKKFLDSSSLNMNDLQKSNIAFILEEFTNEKYKIKKMNLNKANLYLFSKSPFSVLNYIGLPEIEISSYPLYSPKNENYYQKLKDYNIIIENGDYLEEGKSFRHLFKDSFIFKEKITSFDEKLLKYYKELLKEFANWSAKEIKKWEEKTKILEYFQIGDKIS